MDLYRGRRPLWASSGNPNGLDQAQLDALEQFTATREDKRYSGAEISVRMQNAGLSPVHDHEHPGDDPR